MFERQVLFYLKKYLGTYLEGVDESSLKISVWAGDVLLQNLKLRVEAFEELDLPLVVQAGLVGSLRLTVPWSALGKEPVRLEIDKVFALVKTKEELPKELSLEEYQDAIVTMLEAVLDRKRKRLLEAELKWMESLATKESTEAASTGFFEYYLKTILANLEVKISNLHFRYEDDCTSDGKRFCLGLMLSELSAHTVDDHGERTFVPGKELRMIQKLASVKQLSLYFKPEAETWFSSKDWKTSDFKEWDDAFLTPIQNQSSLDQKYFLHPVDAVLKYRQNRHVRGHKWAASAPTRSIDISLHEVDATLSRKQYELIQSLLMVFDMYQRRVSCCSQRPPSHPKSKQSIKLWWIYAFLSVKQKYGLSSSWDLSKIAELADLRRHYIEVYAQCLKDGVVGGNDKSRIIEKSLPEHSIFTFRKLAHLQVESDRRAEAAKAAKEQSSSWYNWFWGSTESTEEKKEETSEGNFSKEDWGRLLQTVDFEEEEEDVYDTPFTLQLQFSFQVDSCSLSLLDFQDACFLHGTLHNTKAYYKQYPKTRSYGLTVFQANLENKDYPMMTTVREKGEEMDSAFLFEYVSCPQDSMAAARVNIETSSTYIIFQTETINALMEFLKANEAVNVAALEAKAVSTFKEARSLAEKQVMDFKDFYEIKVQLKAPKLAVPCIKDAASSEDITFVLDLGTLNLNSVDQKLQEEQKFNMGINDVASYLYYGEFSWSKLHDLAPESPALVPVLDKMGFNAELCLISALGLKTKLGVHCSLPEIRFHLSPHRYKAIVSVASSVCEVFDSTCSPVQLEADNVGIHGEISVLVWEGLGNQTPKWKKYYGSIRDSYFYVKNISNNEIVRWIRLDQDLEIVSVPEKWTLGRKHVLGIMTKDTPVKKAMEDSSALMVSLTDEERLLKWKEQLLFVQKRDFLETQDLSLHEVNLSQRIPEEAPVKGFEFRLKGSVDQICLLVYGHPPKPSVMNLVCTSSEGIDSEKETPLILSKQEKSSVSVVYDCEVGLDVDIGIVHYSIEDLLYLSTTGKQSYLSISSLGDQIENQKTGEYVKMSFRHLVGEKSEEEADHEVELEFNDVYLEVHRTTIAAIIGLVNDLSAIEVSCSERQDHQLNSLDEADEVGSTLPATSYVNSEVAWRNPDRILFRLKMVSSNTYLSMNYEDEGKKLATARFRNFKLGVDVGTKDFEITSTLGNALIYDETLPEDHSLRQICGLKNKSGSSLIKASFQSHDVKASYSWDQVPSGNAFYFLQANLAHVQLVYYQRFIDQFLDYIYVLSEMIPAPTSAETETSALDIATSALKAAGVNESTIVVMDIQMQEPKGLLPRNSKSMDMMIVELENAHLINTFDFTNGHSTLIQTMHIQLSKTALAVKYGYKEGKNLLRNCNGMAEIDVQTVLKDKTKTLPWIQTNVQIPSLSGTITDNELEVIIECCNDNFFEDMTLPMVASQLSEMLIAQFPLLSPVSPSIPLHNIAYSSSANITNIQIHNSCLTLYNTSKCGSNPLALCCVRCVELFCCVKSLESGRSVSLSVPSIEVTDIRPNAIIKDQIVFSSQTKMNQQKEENLTSIFLRTYYRWVGNEQELKIDLQKPKLSLEPEFLLSLVNFFHPDCNLGLTNLADFCSHDILLTETPFKAQHDLYLSPEVRLLADSPDVNSFVYDGDGHSLILPNELDPRDSLPLILVGTNKTLHFRNVNFINSQSLSTVLQLKAGAQVLAREEDGVYLKAKAGLDQKTTSSSHKFHSKRLSMGRNMVMPCEQPVMIFRIRALGAILELVDVSSMRKQQCTGNQDTGFVHKLQTMFDAEGTYHSVGMDIQAEGIIHSLVMDIARSMMDSTEKNDPNTFLQRVLEPCDLTGKWRTENSTKNLEFNLDRLALNVTPDVVGMAMKMQKQLLEPLVLPQSGQPTIPCPGYDLIWTNHSTTTKGKDSGGPGISFWRPQCPAGYAILGDVATVGQVPLSQQALCVSMSGGFVAFPTHYTPILDFEDGLTLWEPIPPQGYVALGCLAQTSSISRQKPPPDTACVCVHKRVVVEAFLGSCLWIDSTKTIWNIRNAAHSFSVSKTKYAQPEGPFFNLRFPIGRNIPNPSINALSWCGDSIERYSLRAYEKFKENQTARLNDSTLQKTVISTVEFRRLYSEMDTNKHTPIGFWRPIPPNGYCWLGDCFQLKDKGPPRSAHVFCLDHPDQIDHYFTKPKGFKKLFLETPARVKTLPVLKPIPQDGFVALGYVFQAEHSITPSLDAFRCVRSDLVESIDPSDLTLSAQVTHGKRNFFLWETDTNLHTFVVSTTDAVPAEDGLYKLKRFEEIFEAKRDLVAEKDKLFCVVKCGPTSVQLRDLTQIPVMEIDIETIRMTTEQFGSFTKAFCDLDCSISSYNVVQKYWEPVLLPTNLLMNFRQNLNEVEMDGFKPGQHLRITAKEKPVSFILSCSAMKRLIDAFSEWSGLCPEETDEALSQDVGKTPVFNASGSTIEMLCDYGWTQKVFSIESGKSLSIPLPLHSPQRRQSDLHRISQSREMLGVVIRRASGKFIANKELFVDVRLNVEGPVKEESLFAVRKAQATEDGEVIWNQQCITHYKFGISEGSKIRFELFDVTHGIQSQLLASTELQISSYSFDIPAEETRSRYQSLQLEIAEDCLLEVELFKEASVAEAYGMETSSEYYNTRGNRALSLGFSADWVSIPIGGLQHVQNRSTPLIYCANLPSSIFPIKLDGGLVIERSFQDGVRYEVIRSLCTFVNSTSFDLQVRLAQESESGSVHNLQSTSMDDCVEHEVFENERYLPVVGFKAKLIHDSRRYSLTSKGDLLLSQFPQITPPSRWEWKGPWTLDKTQNVDSEGWAYSTDLHSMTWPPKEGSEKYRVYTTVRQRRWLRKRGRVRLHSSTSCSELCDIIGVCPTGKALPLPKTWSKPNTILQVKPIINNRVWHDWNLLSCPETSALHLPRCSDGDTFLAVCHLDPELADDQLEAPEKAWNCLNSFWISLTVESERLPLAEAAEGLVDWTVTAQSPLTLQNLLKIPGQVEVFEKSGGKGPAIVRQTESCPPDGLLPIHTVDTRKEISFHFTPEGYRLDEKDPVTLSFGFSQFTAGLGDRQSLPDHFGVKSDNGKGWITIQRIVDQGMNHQEKNLDPGAAVALGYPMVCQLYVPLWIINNSKVPVEASIVSFCQSKTELKIPFRPESSGESVSKQPQEDFHVFSIDTYPDSSSKKAYQSGNLAIVDGLKSGFLSHPITDEYQYGVQLTVQGSGPAPPIAITPVKVSRSVEKRRLSRPISSGFLNVEKMIINARVYSSVNKIFRLVATLETTGNGLIRSKTLQINPCYTTTNQTGVDLYLYQPSAPVENNRKEGVKEMVDFSGKLQTDEQTDVLYLKPGLQKEELHDQLESPDGVCQVSGIFPCTSSLSKWSGPFHFHSETAGDFHLVLTRKPEANSRDQLLDEIPTRCFLHCRIRKITQEQSRLVFSSIGFEAPIVLENRTLAPLNCKQKNAPLAFPEEKISPLSAAGWALPILTQQTPCFCLYNPLLPPQDRLNGTFSHRLDLDLPLDEMVSLSGGKEDQIVSLRSPEETGIVEIIDLSDIDGYYSVYQTMEAAYQQHWGRERLIRIYPEEAYRQSNRTQSKVHFISQPERECWLGSMFSGSDGQIVHWSLEVESLEISVVDHIPRELIFIALNNLRVETLSGLGPKSHHCQLRVGIQSAQVDDQLLGSEYPVLAKPWTKSKTKTDQSMIFTLAITGDDDLHHGKKRYPYFVSHLGNIDLSIHEPIVWRLVEMFKFLNLSQSGSSTSSSSWNLDVELEVLLMHVGGFCVNVTTRTEPLARPRSVKSHSLSLGLELATIEDVEVPLRGYHRENITGAPSIIWKMLYTHVRDQAWRAFVNLLQSYFALGGVSQALSYVGKAIKTTSESADVPVGSSSRVDSFHDGLLQGGTTIAKGVFSGVTGALTKPLAGAKKDGVKGFAKGVGTGVLGIATNSIGGLFEAAGKVTQGIDALKDDITAVIISKKSDDENSRTRLPLCIRGDQRVASFDQGNALGQWIMYVAHNATNKGAFSRQSASSAEEFYENHIFLTPTSVLLWSTERISVVSGADLKEWYGLMMICSAAERLPIPELKLTWSVLWTEVLAINIANQPRSSSSHHSNVIIIHLKTASVSKHGPLKTVSCNLAEERKLLEEIWKSIEKYSIAAHGNNNLISAHLSRRDLLSDTVSYTLPCAGFSPIAKRGFKGFILSIWRPNLFQGYGSVGDVVLISKDDIDPDPMPVFLDDSSLSRPEGLSRLAHPVAFNLVFRDDSPQHGLLTLWEPIPPPGYVALSCLAMAKIAMPSVESVFCLRDDLSLPSQQNPQKIWKQAWSHVHGMVSCMWLKSNQSQGFFVVTTEQSSPSPLSMRIPDIKKLNLPEKS